MSSFSSIWRTASWTKVCWTCCSFCTGSCSLPCAPSPPVNELTEERIAFLCRIIKHHHMTNFLCPRHYFNHLLTKGANLCMKRSDYVLVLSRQTERSFIMK